MADDINADSSDTNTTEQSGPLTFLKLPVDILEKVTGKLSLVDCLSLRKVCRGLRSLVDSSKLQCKTVGFWFGDNWAEMVLDGLDLGYEENENGGCMITLRRKYAKEKTYIHDRNFIHTLIGDAATFLRNPKLEIGIMELKGHGSSRELFVHFLKSINFRLNARSIRSYDLGFLLSIQKFLNPEKLEEILCNGVDNVIRFSETPKADFDILKNPKLKLERLFFNFYTDELAAKFSKFLNSVDCQFRIQDVVVVDGRFIPWILQSLNPEKVDNITIREIELTVAQFNQISEKEEWKMKTKLEFSMLPEEIGLEQLAGFKKIQNYEFELTEDILIKIRDVLLKSPHFGTLKITTFVHPENVEDQMNQMNERIERIMCQDPSYDAATRRFSIPNSRDYFQLKLKYPMRFMIEKISSE